MMRAPNSAIPMMHEAGFVPESVAALDARARRFTTVHEDKHVVWRVWGEGPALLLLHGGHGSWMHWLRNVDGLAGRFRAIVPDMPSYGDSDALARDATLADYARALASGLRDVAGDEAVTLCGFSFGGVVAGELARQIPEAFSRVVFVGTGGLALTRPPMDEMVRWREREGAALFAAHRRNLEILMIADPARIDDTATWIQARNAARTRGLSRPISLGPALARNLPYLAMPLAFIWGEADATAKGYLAERRAFLGELVPSAPVIVVPGAGHWLQYEDPEGFDAAFDAAIRAG